MRKVIYILALTTLGLGLWACGNKTPPANRMAGRTGTAGGSPAQGYVGQTYGSNSNNMVWGQVTGYSQQSVQDLVSTNPNIQVGQTTGCSTLAGQPCAIVFNVSTDPFNNQFLPILVSPVGGSQTQFQASNMGVLTIAIYDSLTGNGMGAIAVVVPLQTATMNYASGVGSAQLTFGDSSGTIMMNGTISGSVFSGAVTFTNTTGSGQANEPLGSFTTPICAVFQCN